MQADQLSPREVVVLELLARGATNAEIAAQLKISEEAVESRVKHILEKLDVSNRTEAALRYVQLYGPPSRLDRPGIVTVDAVVIETSADGGVRLRLEDASEQQLSAPEEMSQLLRPGLRVVLYHSPNGDLLGWYLPEHGVGNDLRS